MNDDFKPLTKIANLRYLVLALHNEIFKWLQEYFKNRLTVSSNSSYSFGEGRRPTKLRRKRRRWRNGQILQSVNNHEIHAVHLNN